MPSLHSYSFKKIFRAQVQPVRSFKSYLAAIATLHFSTALSGFAANKLNTISASGGIAASSFSSAVFQNPAAIIYAPKLNLTTQARWDQAFTNGIYQGGLLYGNGNLGLTGGGSVPSSNMKDSEVYYGVAAGSPQVSLGISGSSGFSSHIGTELHAGVLISPQETFSFGFTAHDFNSSDPEWGGGLRLQVSQAAALVVDVTSKSSFNSFHAQPGFTLGDEVVAVTASYGFGSGSRQLSDGFAAGGSLQLGHNVNWQAYYNQLAVIFTSISIRL